MYEEMTIRQAKEAARRPTCRGQCVVCVAFANEMSDRIVVTHESHTQECQWDWAMMHRAANGGFSYPHSLDTNSPPAKKKLKLDLDILKLNPPAPSQWDPDAKIPEGWAPLHRPKCDCGADKCRTTHARWCSVYRAEK